METFRRGDPITLVQQFWTIDPISKASTPADPTTVVFLVEDPNGVTTSYTFGVDSNVTNPLTGTFLCALDPPVPPGEYRWRCEGGGAVVAVFEGAFTVLESGVLPPDPATVPMPGPCSSWISGEEVAEAGPSLGVGSNTWLLDDAAYVASHVLYELSGRQFPGVCQRTVRPCRDGCGCFGVSSGLGPYYWTLASWYGGGWGWRNEYGQSCGCGNESYVRLAGYPVREILAVKIDGHVLASTGEYRLDDRRNLIRLADVSGPVPVDRGWPACQDLSLDDSQPGTFSVKYTWGADVPAIGRMAAAQFAREVYLAFNGDACKLPTRVTKVVRQGISYEKIVPTADLLRSGTTGLQLVDAFLATVNPTKAKRRSVVWSPDLQPFARKVGQ